MTDKQIAVRTLVYVLRLGGHLLSLTCQPPQTKVLCPLDHGECLPAVEEDPFPPPSQHRIYRVGCDHPHYSSQHCLLLYYAYINII